jgi:hypothetical protein
VPGAARVVSGYPAGRRGWISRVSASIFSVSCSVFLSQDSVRLDQQLQRAGLLLDRRLSLLHVAHDLVAVYLEMIERILVSIGLAGLREQDA